MSFMMLWLLLSLVTVGANTIDDVEKLRNFLFASYNKEVRPPYNLSTPLPIYITFSLSAFHDVDDANGVISAVGAFYLMWYDDRLVWNSTEYGGLEYITVKNNLIWMPRLFLLNTADLKILTTNTVMIRISMNGTINVIMGGVMRTNFDPRMTYFPFDTQVCSMRVVILGYYHFEAYLVNMREDIELTTFIENNGWDLIRTSAKPYTLGQYSGMLEYQLILRRRHLYISINTVAPLVILTLVNPMVFLLPIDGGERVSFSVTMLLSFGVFLTQISDDLPEVSDPMAYISYFLMITLVGSAMITLLVVIISNLYLTDPAKPVHGFVRVLIFLLSLRYLRHLCHRCYGRKLIKKDKDKSKEEEEEEEEENECSGECCDRRQIIIYTRQDAAKDINYLSFIFLWMVLSLLLIASIAIIKTSAYEESS